MHKKDVTKHVEFENNDDECLPITKCVCGHKFPAWEFIISYGYEGYPLHECPKCGAKLYFSNEIKVYQIIP